MTAFLYNPKFPGSLSYQMISPWLQRNLFQYGHLVNPVTRELLPFDKLCAKYDLPRSALFGCLQFWHYALTFAPNLKFSKPSPFESLILHGSSKRGLTSDIYKILDSYNVDSLGKHSYVLKWEENLGEELSSAQWQIIWSHAAKSSICTLYKNT